MIGDLIEKCLWEINDLRQRRPDVYRQIEVLILAIMDHLETFRLVVDHRPNDHTSDSYRNLVESVVDDESNDMRRAARELRKAIEVDGQLNSRGLTGQADKQPRMSE